MDVDVACIYKSVFSIIIRHVYTLKIEISLGIHTVVIKLIFHPKKRNLSYPLKTDQTVWMRRLI